MGDGYVDKLLGLTIKKRELNVLLRRLGFVKKGGKGSHERWVMAGVGVIVLATHDKEVKPYQLKQVILVLRSARLI